ncbi:hypothetical protein ACVWW4_004797 [Bradyrhizobium sp. LB7.1]
MRQIKNVVNRDGADHRKLRQRPDHRQREQHPACRHLVDDEADYDGGNREQEEERGAEQTKLLRLEIQVCHDRHAGEADDDLVGEVYQHEQKQQKGDRPGSLWRPRRLARHRCRSLSAHDSPPVVFLALF